MAYLRNPIIEYSGKKHNAMLKILERVYIVNLKLIWKEAVKIVYSPRKLKKTLGIRHYAERFLFFYVMIRQTN